MQSKVTGIDVGDAAWRHVFFVMRGCKFGKGVLSITFSFSQRKRSLSEPKSLLKMTKLSERHAPLYGAF